MRLGINVSDLEYEQVISLGERAESVGLDSVWTGETWGWEAFTPIGELAARTDEITLGTGIVPVYSRSPALLGQSVATAAEASDGRFVLGLGSSGPAVIENWHGAEFERPVGRTAETISIVRKVLSGDVVSHDGTEFELDGFRLRKRPTYTDVPIFVGALGPSNVRMAGAVADGWMPIFMPRPRIVDLMEEFESSARERDRDPDDLTVAPNLVAAVSEDGEAAREAVRHHLAFYVGTMGEFYHRMLTDSGFGDVADDVREAWNEEGPEAASAAVSDEVLTRSSIVGTPEEAAAQLDEYEAVGADHVTCFFPRDADADLMTETTDHLGAYRSD